MRYISLFEMPFSLAKEIAAAQHDQNSPCEMLAVAVE
jgi:hypothetical protein